ncbi:hypothetical protein ABWED_0430 [Acinetobacter lwoffii]|nr:hypothetical protein ABEKA_1209 [Acinetobacter lwoffii]QZM11729.1 hypothetical protein ABVS_1028 [Acinetobacter lwoffii]UHT63655.1 hypothetical protein ABEDC_0391 [Acinetobacter lwoffii]UVA99767.1 hypothetical protein ABWED_0430 [Acinetobacter lwoffii]
MIIHIRDKKTLMNSVNKNVRKANRFLRLMNEIIEFHH